MLLYVLKLNQNAKMPEAYGKYYAYPVITQTVGIDGKFSIEVQKFEGFQAL